MRNEALAAWAAADGRPARALRLAGAAAALHDALGSPLASPAGTAGAVEAACQVLGDAAAQAAWGEGQLMTLEQAVAALEDAPDPP